jgi:hypothetical protein
MRTRPLLAAAGIAAAALAGYLLATTILAGHTTTSARTSLGTSPAHPSRHSTTTPPAPTPAASSQSPSAHTPFGAVMAADTYLRALSPGQADSLIATLKAITLPPLTAQALQAQSTASALARRASASGPGFMRGWQLGWRIESYAPTLSRVAIWTMGLAAAPSEVVPPDWSTTLCMLQWSHGSWRVKAASTSPGPTPPPDGSDQPAVAAFARHASGFRGFSDAP